MYTENYPLQSFNYYINTQGKSVLDGVCGVEYGILNGVEYDIFWFLTGQRKSYNMPDERVISTSALTFRFVPVKGIS